MNTSRRNWKRCATPSSPNCIKVVLEECQGECLVECLVASLVELEAALPLVQPSRRSTKRSSNGFQGAFIY